MNRIAEEVERDPNYGAIIDAQRSEPEATGADAISLAARQIAETLNLSAIITYTLPARPACAPRASGRRCRSSRSRRSSTGRGACRSSGACIASSPDATTWTTWSIAPAASPSRRIRRPATASSSRPACRWGRRLHQHAAHRLCRFGRRNEEVVMTQRRSSVIFVFSSFDTGQPALAIACKLLERRLVRARDLRIQRQMNRGDRKTIALLFQRDVGLGLHVFGGELGFAQNQRQRHGEAGSLRRADQLLEPGLPSKRLAKPYILQRAASVDSRPCRP